MNSSAFNMMMISKLRSLNLYLYSLSTAGNLDQSRLIQDDHGENTRYGAFSTLSKYFVNYYVTSLNLRTTGLFIRL